MNLKGRIYEWGGRRLRRSVLAFALTALVSGGVHFGATERASAGDRRTICWEKVYVRNYPQGRAWDQLYKGQTFEVYEYRQSGWARGFAYGHINKNKSPYQKPYDDIWIQTAAFCPR
jgi:hypothetical protein